jgi:LPXTG-motif cell wall-anchored protein
MGIVNKRNAVVGWIALKVGKRVVKKKAQEVVPRERIHGIAAGALAAVGGVLFFWRRKRDGDASGE